MTHALSPGYFITNEFGDQYLYEVNHNSLNKVGAHSIHEQRFDKLIARDNVLLIICGTDSGTLLSHLDSISFGSGTKVILVELPEILSIINEHLNITTLNNCLKCVVPDDFQLALEQFELKNYLYMGGVELHQSLASEHAFLPEYQELLWNLQTSLQQLSWSIQGSLGSEPFVITQLENLGDNLIPSFHLKNSFQGRTAVLLAGGPSLDDILPWVKENRDRLVVLAVSRISRRLRETQITPDIVFSIDPHQLSFDISREMLLFNPSCLFVHVYHVSSKLLGQWRGKSVYLGNRVPWESELNETSIPHPGPTVSNVAISTAMEMGFERVILAGLDLCHSKNGYTHAAGSNERFAGPQLGKVCIRVETYGGWEAETTSDFASAISILDTQAKTCQEKGVRLINPAPGAARIKHIEHIPLEQITLEAKKRSPQNIFNEILPEVTPKYRINYYKKVIKELSRVLGQLIQIHKLSVEAIRCNDGLFGRKGIKRDFKHKKRMDKIEKTLNKKHREFTRFTRTFGIRNFLKLTRIDRDKDWDDDEIEKTGRAYYQAYKNSSSTLIDLVRQSRKRIEARMEEDKESPQLDIIFKQWREDEQPGRISVWLSR
ncbi:MAG: DUF115 domain-containing protein, partial [Desulfobulbaceae bacterium]|nr:DUF115 domain-containing protein [Desulfobulbaceae bacterium]